VVCRIDHRPHTPLRSAGAFASLCCLTGASAWSVRTEHRFRTHPAAAVAAARCSKVPRGREDQAPPPRSQAIHLSSRRQRGLGTPSPSFAIRWRPQVSSQRSLDASEAGELRQVVVGHRKFPSRVNSTCSWGSCSSARCRLKKIEFRRNRGDVPCILVALTGPAPPPPNPRGLSKPPAYRGLCFAVIGRT